MDKAHGGWEDGQSPPPTGLRRHKRPRTRQERIQDTEDEEYALLAEMEEQGDVDYLRTPTTHQEHEPTNHKLPRPERWRRENNKPP